MMARGDGSGNESSEDAKHRRELEKKKLNAVIVDRQRHQDFKRRVLWFTLVVVLFGLGAAVLLAMLGCQSAAVVVGSGSVAVFTTFLWLGIPRNPEEKASED